VALHVKIMCVHSWLDLIMHSVCLHHSRNRARYDGNNMVQDSPRGDVILQCTFKTCTRNACEWL
jgi:hypothetical protein